MKRRVGVVFVTAALALSAVAAPATAEELPLRSAVSSAAGARLPVEVTGSGWGHSVGLSQYGAYAMARDGGKVAGQILYHYYPGTKVSRVELPDGPFSVGLYYQATDVPIEATGGSINWVECSSDGSCTSGDSQPKGTTWKVTFGGGVMRLERHDGSTDTAASGAEYRAYHDETVVTGPNPLKNGEGVTSPPATTRYKRGFLRFRANYENNGVLVASQLDSIEEYLYGLAEMPLSWGENGLHALRAQAIIGRTYALRQAFAGHVGGDDWRGCGCQIRATPAMQAWHGYEVEGNSTYGHHWVAAVETTPSPASDPRRQVLTYNDQPAWTFYSSSHGGASEDVQDSWAFSGTTDSYPYLVSVEDPWSLIASNPYRSWDRTLSNGSMARLVDGDGGITEVTRIQIQSRTSGGTPERLRVTGELSNGEVRTITWPSVVPDPAGARMRSWFGGTVLRSQQIGRMGFGPFTDDDGNAHEYAIAFAKAGGITQGKTATTFAPDLSLTRGEMAAFLYRTFDIPKSSTRAFSDVPASHTHAEAIDAIAKAGITQGYSNGTYRPYKTVTRAEMATFLARALDLPGKDPSVYFDDVNDATHGQNIGAIAEAGISLGYGGRRYAPRNPVSRGEMVTFMRRAAETYG